MTIIRFGDFNFDGQRLQLTRRNQPLPLRPKAALILGLLLERKGQLVCKEELVARAWNGRLIQDQTLFQTISELRRALGPDHAVINVPNAGYRLVPSSGSQPRARLSRLVRWVPAMVLVALVSGSGSPGAGAPDNQPVYAAPAIRAFSMGMASLDQPERARRYFEIAAAENRGFLEARLMLAEALFSQGARDQALAEVSGLLDLARRQQSSYVEAGAMDLLSRMSESSGAADDALRWAERALDTATSKGFACAAEESGRRVLDLLAKSIPLASPLPNAPAAIEAEQKRLAVVHCQEITPAARDDLSHCSPPVKLPLTPPHLAIRREFA